MSLELKALRRLEEEAIAWWEKHQYDVNITDGEEYNRYDEVPRFVRFAWMSRSKRKEEERRQGN